MSERDDHSSGHHDGDAERLGHLVRSFQKHLLEWRRICELCDGVTLGPEHLAHEQLLAQRMSDALEQLYIAIEPSLLKLAQRWIASQQFQQIATTREFPEAMQTLARSAFGAVIEALPMLSVDTTRNVRGLLITIAKNDLFDQEHKIYKPSPRRKSKPEEILDSGDTDGAMWLSSDPLSGEASISEEIKDHSGTDFEDHILSSEQHHHVWPIVIEFWQQSLSLENLWLIQMRWFNDPAVPFKEIARRIGEGWTEAAVKERHHRILKRTRQYLKNRGLLHDGTEGR